MSTFMLEVCKNIAQKRTIRGLEKYEAEIDTLWEHGKITDADFKVANNAFIEQATLIYEQEIKTLEERTV